MSSTRDPGKFFQTEYVSIFHNIPLPNKRLSLTYPTPSDSIAEQKRKAAKSRNTNGQPIKLPSKILAIVADPGARNAVYVAESSGMARKVDLLVCFDLVSTLCRPMLLDD